MSRRPSPLPSQLGRVFTRAEAVAAGVPPHRLRCADLERPFHGVYRRISSASDGGTAGRVRFTSRQEPDDAKHPDELWREAQCEAARAFQHVMPLGHAFGGRTALCLIGVQVSAPEHPEERSMLDLVCVRPTRPVRYRGVRVRRVSPSVPAPQSKYGCTLIDPATAWASIAAELSLDDRVAIGDAVIRRSRVPGTGRLTEQPHASLADLAAVTALHAASTRHLLEEALPLITPHSASPPESHLRLRIREWGLPSPDLDFDVYDDEGALLGCTEIVFARYKIAVEYEGDGHRTTRRQWNRDIQKYQAYERQGWIVIRVTAYSFYRDPWTVRQAIESALRRRGWEG